MCARFVRSERTLGELFAGRYCTLRDAPLLAYCYHQRGRARQGLIMGP